MRAQDDRDDRPAAVSKTPQPTQMLAAEPAPRYVLMNFVFSAGYSAKGHPGQGDFGAPQFTQAEQAATIQAHTGAPLR